MCTARDQLVNYTWFEEIQRYLCIWKNLGAYMTGDLIINRLFRHVLQHSNKYPVADCVSKLGIKLQKLKKIKLNL